MSRYERVPSPDATTVFEYHDLTPPTPRDVYEARQVVSRYLPKTPLVRSEALSARLDADVYLKREDTLPTGAFKVRGGMNLVSRLDEEFRDPGLICASTGNHGQSVALAGREFGVPVVVAVPEDANPDKVAAMEQLGARVEHHGDDYDDAREWAEELAAAEGYRYVHSANEPKLIAGVGTAGLEVLEELPEVDTLVCPIGGGSSAAGYCLTVGTVGGADVIGVQASGADAMYRGFHGDHLEEIDAVDTMAEGVASRVPFALTMEVLREHLHDLRRVDDDAIEDALRLLFREEHLVAEGASATAVAAALEMGDELAGRTVVLQLSGRNIDTEKFRRIVGE
jgi:threonine dehydratase